MNHHQPAAASGNLPRLVAVDGFSGAGKTTFAAALASRLRRTGTVEIFSLEDVYPGWDGLAAGMEYYHRHVLAPLAAGETAHWQAWDWAANRYAAARSTAPADVVVLEGVGASCRRVRELLTLSIWLEAPEPDRRRRALARDGGTYEPHWEQWAEQERAWAAEDPAERYADLVLPGPAGSRDLERAAAAACPTAAWR